MATETKYRGINRVTTGVHICTMVKTSFLKFYRGKLIYVLKYVLKGSWYPQDYLVIHWSAIGVSVSQPVIAHPCALIQVWHWATVQLDAPATGWWTIWDVWDVFWDWRTIKWFLLTWQNNYPHTAVPRPGHGALCVDRGGAAAILQPTAMLETCWPLVIVA